MRQANRLPFVLFLAAALSLAGCGRHTFEGVDLSEYAPARILAFDVSPPERAGAIDRDAFAAIGEVLDARVYFDIREEPSRRMLPLVAAALWSRARHARVAYVMVAGEPADVQTALAIVGPDAHLDAARAVGGERSGDDQRTELDLGTGELGLPVIVIRGVPDDEPVLKQAGYDLNTRRAIRAAVDGHLREHLTE